MHCSRRSLSCRRTLYAYGNQQEHAMSNAQFRMQQAEFAEARAKKAAWAQRLLADAEALSPVSYCPNSLRG